MGFGRHHYRRCLSDSSQISVSLCLSMSLCLSLLRTNTYLLEHRIQRKAVSESRRRDRRAHLAHRPRSRCLLPVSQRSQGFRGREKKRQRDREDNAEVGVGDRGGSGGGRGMHTWSDARSMTAQSHVHAANAASPSRMTLCRCSTEEGLEYSKYSQRCSSLCGSEHTQMKRSPPDYTPRRRLHLESTIIPDKHDDSPIPGKAAGSRIIAEQHRVRAQRAQNGRRHCLGVKNACTYPFRLRGPSSTARSTVLASPPQRCRFWTGQFARCMKKQQVLKSNLKFHIEFRYCSNEIMKWPC